MSEENNTQLSKILEGAILAAGEPLSVVKLQALFDQDGMPEQSDIEQALGMIKASCEDRGFDLVEVASGWRFQVREDLAQWVNRLWDEKPQKYSRALLETMALIAYRQPLTRGDIEEVRGVAVSSHIIKTLTERGWVKVIGHRDVPGRPALYATTKNFLDYFNLKSLDELPTLGDLKDIESLNQDLEFGILEPAAAPTDHSEEGAEVVEAEAVFDGEDPVEAAADPVLEPAVSSDTPESAERDEDGSASLFDDLADTQAEDGLNAPEVHDTHELNGETVEAEDDPKPDVSPNEDTERLND